MKDVRRDIQCTCTVECMCIKIEYLPAVVVQVVMDKVS